jgi:hypothetical protein
MIWKERTTMAKATKQPADYTLILELSRDEAETLLFVCSAISGMPLTTPRRHTDAIHNALRDAGVPANVHSATGSINFRD